MENVENSILILCKWDNAGRGLKEVLQPSDRQNNTFEEMVPSGGEVSMVTCGGIFFSTEAAFIFSTGKTLATRNQLSHMSGHVSQALKTGETCMQ